VLDGGSGEFELSEDGRRATRAAAWLSTSRTTRVKLLGVWRVATFFVGHEAHRNVLASSQVELNP